MEQLQKKYGLMTAIAMVVGVVIGSGVFFKADDVLSITEGNLIIALLAWIVGACAMIFGALTFAEFASRFEKSNGIVDYFEEAYGKRIGYLMGWFNGILYYAPLSAILAWIASLYTMILLGYTNPTNSMTTWILAAVFLVLSYLLNSFAPKIAGHFQVTTTFIKLIPLVLIAVVGLFNGLIQGVTIDNFTAAAQTLSSQGKTFSSAVVSTAFAYEGWVIAVTLNSEIKDSKKNLPRALFLGSIIVFIIYVSYFLGMSSVLETQVIISQGDESVNLVSNQLFGSLGATLLTIFVIISCLGTLNGLVMACIRTPFSLAIRNQGPIVKFMSKINTKTGMPLFAAGYAFILSAIYLFIWWGSFNNLFGRFISIDEIPIVMIYGFYVLLYIWYMIHFKDLRFFKRFMIPGIALIGAGIILFGGMTNPSIGFYMLISLLVITFGLLFYRK